MRLRPKATNERAPAELSGVLRRGLRDALRGTPMKASARKRLLAYGLIENASGSFSRLTPAGLKALRDFSNGQ